MNFELHRKSLEIVSACRSLLIRLKLVSKCLDKSVCKSVCCSDSSISELRAFCLKKHYAPKQITALEFTNLEMSHLFDEIQLILQGIVIR
jgi:hypothetical protein